MSNSSKTQRPLRMAFAASQDLRVASNGVNSHSRNLLSGLRALGVDPVAVLHPASGAAGRRRLTASRILGRIGDSADARALRDLRTRHDILVDAVRRAPGIGSVEVVHAQDFVAAAAVLDALGSKAPPIVLAHHVNGLAAEELAERFALDPGAAAVAWARAQSERALAAAAFVVAVSPWAGEVLRTKAAVPPDRLAVVRNGVAVPERAPDPAMRQPGLVLGVGQIVERKGFDILVEAMRRLSQSGATDAEAVVLGDGPERGRLSAQAAHPPAARVRFPGASDDVSPWLSRAQVFCLPSRAENLPMALLEAMAQGLPIVASDVGGVAEAIAGADEAAGILVPAADAEALATALGRVLKDPEAARAMGARAHARARDRYSLEAMARDWLSLYRRAMNPA